MTAAPSRPKIVLLGLMTRMPVAGVVWQTVHYLVGLQRLGYDVYYVEAHACTPSTFIENEDEDGSDRAADFIARVMRRFDLGDRWAYQALHADGRCRGMTEGQLQELYRSAALIINLHGGTIPLPEHYATGRLVYLETDPVELQMELHHNLQTTIDFLAPHCAFFTFGGNFGQPDCQVPLSDRFHFRPTRQPVLMDLWQSAGDDGGEAWTTIGNWRQPHRRVRFNGEVYHWSKHFEFLKFLNLPRRSRESFELALSGYNEADQQKLEAKGWRVRLAEDLSTDIDLYRRYIGRSKGEFTVAKDQNIRLRSGWFSDRSATYLAAGRPVITQDTGFGSYLPTGEGLFSFSTMDEILAAVDAINLDYAGHCRAAREVAREYFDAEVVLGNLLEQVGVSRMAGTVPAAIGERPDSNPSTPVTRFGSTLPFPVDMVLTPLSRNPIRLEDATVAVVMDRPVPTFSVPHDPAVPRVNIVVVTFDNLLFTRMCLESLLARTEYANYEVCVVDNASTDGTPDYLRQLAAKHPHVRFTLNDSNRGFAAANNQALKQESGDVLILLNNDTLVSKGWVTGLVRYLQDPAIGLVGPTTNRLGNEAEIKTCYRTYGEFEEFAAAVAKRRDFERFDIRIGSMFCLAMRRNTFEQLGPLDEQFGVGMLEDDDYSMRARAAGLRVICAENLFVHHFGSASIGKLAASGEYGPLFHANRRRWEAKWGRPWEPPSLRPNVVYENLRESIRQVVCESTPPAATVLVVSKGDEELLNLLRANGRKASHFPQMPDGCYAGSHPADSQAAIAQLEQLRADGGEFLLFPSTASWWLDHYRDFAMHLERRYPKVIGRPDTCVVYALREGGRSDV